MMMVKAVLEWLLCECWSGRNSETMLLLSRDGTVASIWAVIDFDMCKPAWKPTFRIWQEQQEATDVIV